MRANSSLDEKVPDQGVIDIDSAIDFEGGALFPKLDGSAYLADRHIAHLTEHQIGNPELRAVVTRADREGDDGLDAVDNVVARILLIHERAAVDAAEPERDAEVRRLYVLLTSLCHYRALMM